MPMSHSFTHVEKDGSESRFIFNGDLSGDVLISTVHVDDVKRYGSMGSDTSLVSGEALIALFKKYKHLLEEQS